MLPLSGGADSAAVSLLVKIMCDKISNPMNWNYIKENNKTSRIVERLIVFNPNQNQASIPTSEFICSIILKSVFLPVRGRSFKEGNDPSSGETYKRSKAIADFIGSEWRSTDITDIYKAAKKIGATIMKEEIKKTTNNIKRLHNNIRIAKPSGPTLGVKEIINPGLLINNSKNSADVKESKNKLRSELESLRNLIIQNPTPSSNANLSLLNRVINVERFPRGLKETGTKNGKVENIDIAKAWSKFGLVDECVQARIRMVVNYILSASLNESSFLLTLACSNADEVLIGYYTKYDASSGDLNPIGSMPKRFVNKALEYYSLLWDSKAYADILIATPTAELSNAKEGARVQTDEDEIGLTYDQIYYFGKLRSQGYGMITMFDYIRKHMNNTDIKNLVIPGKKLNNNSGNKINTIKYIAQKVKTFFSKYAINRHKTVILTPSVHLLPSPDDNRFDLRPFLYPAFVEQSKYIDGIISKL
jgi:NAD+ synthetase